MKQCDVVAPRDGGGMCSDGSRDLSEDVAGSQETFDLVQMS